MPFDSEMMMLLQQTPDRATASGGNTPTQFRAINARGMGRVPSKETSDVYASPPGEYARSVIHYGAEDAAISDCGRLTNQVGEAGRPDLTGQSALTGRPLLPPQH